MIDALRGGAGEPAWAAASTPIMQTCFFAHLRRAAARRGDRADQAGDREDLRQDAATEVVAAELRRGRRHARAPARGDGARRRSPRRARVRRSVPADAPDFVQRVTAVMLAGKGDLLPVSAFPVDGTWPTGTAQWEKRNIALEIPVWDAAICIQCNKCALVCPHAAIRAKVYDAGGARPARRRRFKSMRLQGRRVHRAEVHDPGGARGLHRLRRCASMVCPAKDKANPRHKAIDMAPQPPLRERGARELRVLPRPARGRPRDACTLDVKGTQFLQPLFEFSGACAGCGETPYLKLLTQLFGDRAADRQRHRLLVDLRRQPADDALHVERATAAARPGRTRCSRTTPSSASACGWPSTSTSEHGARAAAAARRRASATSWSTRCSTADQSDEAGHRAPSASASRRCEAALAGHRRRRRARGCEPLADYLVQEERLDRRRRRLGLRHRLRRPRPRPRARGATSTSWCSTPRSTPTPAASSRRRRRSARRPSSPPPARRRQEGPRPDGDEPTATSTSRASRSAPRTRRRCRRSQEAEALPGPVADHRLQPLHRARLRPGARRSSSRSWRSTRASGRSTASIRGASPRASRRCSSTRGAPKIAGARLHAQRDALPHGRAAATRSASRRCSRQARARRPRSACARLPSSSRGMHGPADDAAPSRPAAGAGRTTEETPWTSSTTYLGLRRCRTR